MKPLKLAAPLAAAIVLLAGCGGGGTEAAPTPTVASSATPSKAAEAVRYASVTELRDALINAGYPCPNWEQSNHMTAAAESGTCSDSDVLSIYLTETEVSQQVAQAKEIGFDLHWLVGPNWILNLPVSRINMVKNSLGGTIVTTDS